MKKLAIVTTHPVQYNAPLFRMLHERGNTEIMVFYTWSQSKAGEKYDPGFQKNIAWDIPLLTGYPFVFSENVSPVPGSHHYKGIDNPSLITELAAWGADAILVYGWNFKSHIKLMRHFHGRIPVLFRGDSTLTDEKPGWKKAARRIFLRYIFSFADKALYAGKANKAYFLAHGLKEHELIFMPHAIDNRRFAGDDLTKAAACALREKLNIPANAVIFLFAGKLEKKKQPALPAEVLTEIQQPDTWLVIAGSGKLESVLRKKYETNPRIRFLDFQNQQQMPALYAAADVFILPSEGPGETWGLAVNEAMAASKAVLVSRACGAAYDLVEEGKNGFTFMPHNKEELVNYFQLLANDKMLIKEMGRRSAEIIAGYSYEQDCLAIETAMENVKINKAD